MRSILLCAAAVLLSTGRAQAATCTPGADLFFYVSLGSMGCQAGSLTFSDFELLSPLPSGANPINPAEVFITPLTGFNSGLSFLLNQSVTGSYSSLRLGFLVSSSQLINGANLQMTGSAGGSGLADVIYEGCEGQPAIAGFCPGASSNAITFVSEFDSDLSEFAPNMRQALLGVSLQFDADGTGGTATLGTAAVTFAEVPEPSYALFIGPALLAAALARSRLRQTRRC